jgi:dUTP pyrophosphatase
MIKIKIKRFDKSLPLPAYKTKKAAALDLSARKNTTIPAGQVGYIPLNVALEVPANYWVLIAARSSLHKKGLMFANGIGIGDEDYCGDDDEYRAAVFNFTNKPVLITKGERVAQLIVLPRDKITLEEVKTLGNKSRGGFGTTGF